MKVAGVPYVQGRNDNGAMAPSGIAIHCTDNDAPAESEAAYATRRTDGVGAHFYADHRAVIQSIDTDRRTGHAGSGNGNRNALAVEITGRTHWSRQRWLDSVAWDRLAGVLAVVCRQYRITPRRATVAEMSNDPRVRAFYGHDDMRRAWGGTTHTDPGPHFPWDHLLTRVKAALTGDTEDDDMTPAQFLTILKDPAVAQTLRALPWQYVGGGIPAGMSTLGVLDKTLGGVRSLGEVIARESSNPDEIRALLDTMPQPDPVDPAEVAAAILAELTPQQIAGAVLAGLPADLARQVADDLADRLAT